MAVIGTMNSGMFKLAVFATCILFRVQAAEPAGGADNGSGGDFAPGDFVRPAPAKVAATLAWGEHSIRRSIQTQTMFIRHKATEYQRRIAERNAQAFFKSLPPAKKAELKKKKVKAVLIPTIPSRQTSPEAKDVRMRYNLEAESLVDDYAYEFTAPLETGTIAMVKGLDAEYVGQ
jgi:hypothetical protein